MAISIICNDLTVSEADGYAEFVVKLNDPSTLQVSVDYRLASLSAGTYDFGFLSGKLSFAPGVTTQTVRVMLTNDLLPETLEHFALNLSSPVNAVLADNQAVVTIVDNDTMASTTNKASLSVRDVVVDEKAGTATFDIVLDKAVSNSFSVGYATANGSAAGGSDYTAANGSISFAAGQTVRHVSVNITNDSAAELEELFHLNLGSITGSGAGMVQIGDGTGTALIGRSDQTALAKPSFSASDIVVSEAEGYAEFVVRLNAPGTAQASVNYRIEYFNASSYDADFTSGTLSFAPGVTTQTVRIPLEGDSIAEALEGFALNLSSPVNAVLADYQAVATIVDNDTLADIGSKASLSVGDVVVDEKAGTATFDIILDKAVSNGFSVGYATAGGSAASGSDYTAASGLVSFAAGQTVQHVTVNITDDATAELEELFQLNLGAITGNGATMVQISDGAGTALIGRSDQTATAKPFISASDIVISEADGYAEFVVKLNAPGTAQVSVDYRIDSLDASTYDFNFSQGTLSFAPGVTTQTVRVALNSDLTVEALESFALNLSSPVNAVLADNKAVATIVDNDTLADTGDKASLSVRDVVIDEKAGTATFDIVLDKAVANNFSVGYATANGSAASGSDYTAASGRIGFAAGQTVQHVTVNIADDATAELEEMFNLNLGTITGNAAGMVQIADRSGTAMIGRSDQAAVSRPSIIVSDIMIGEADGYAEFVVKLNAPGSAQVSVNYRIDSLTSNAYSDFDPINGTLSFAPGETTQTVRVALDSELTVETLESFTLNLSSPLNAVLGDAHALATIVDNDRFADTASKANLSVRDVVVDEKAGTATFDIVLDKTVANSFSVGYATANGSAASGADYTAASGTISFAAGQTVQHVTVNIADDTATELEEMFNLNLGTVTGNAAGMVQIGDASGTALIGRSDQAALAKPSITASDITVSEADGYAEFVVKLNAPGSEQVSVNYRFTSLSAYAYADFTAVDGTLSFAPGETTQTIRVALNDDIPVETLESFSLNLSSPVNAVLGDTHALATIIDNDTLADIVDKATLSVRDVVVDEKAGTATFDLVLDKLVAESFSVGYATANGSAASGSDYTAANGTIGFAAGQTVQHVTVNIADDATAELDELFHLTLGTVTGNGAATVQIGDASGTALIGRSDQAAIAAPSISASDIVVSEADGYAEFVVKLNAPGSAQVSVNYRFVSLTTYAYSDFDAIDGTLSFAPGETTQTVRVALNNDMTVESLERFALNLSSPVNAVLADAQALASIIDNDDPSLGQVMHYGLGNDTYLVTNSSDIIIEQAGGGTDLAMSSVSYTLADNVENLRLNSASAINGTGNALNNVIYAGNGTNIIDGAAGTDTLSYAFATSASSTNTVGVTLNLSALNAAGQAIASGISGADRISHIENITGSRYNDKLTGDTGANVLDGGAGTDTLSGGLGNDTYYVDRSSDVVTESSDITRGGIDTVISSVTRTLGSYQENLTLSGAAAINGTGNELANKLTGNSGNNSLHGGAGADSLSGGLGNDVLTGGLGRDILKGDAGNDVFDFDLLSEMGLTGSTRDVISDFTSGQDKINLYTLDANTATAANDAFTGFISASASFTKAGQLKFIDGVLYGNVDGDASAEFSIALTGVNSLSVTDIVL